MGSALVILCLLGGILVYYSKNISSIEPVSNTTQKSDLTYVLADSSSASTFSFIGGTVCIATPDFCNGKDAYIFLNREKTYFTGLFSYPEETSKKSEWNDSWSFLGDGEISFEGSQIFQFQNSEWNSGAKRSKNDYWLVLSTVTSLNNQGANGAKKQLLVFYKNPLTDNLEVSQVPTMPELEKLNNVSSIGEGIEISALDSKGLVNKFYLLLTDKIGIADNVTDKGHRFLDTTHVDSAPSDYSETEQDLYYKYGWKRTQEISSKPEVFHSTEVLPISICRTTFKAKHQFVGEVDITKVIADSWGNVQECELFKNNFPEGFELTSSLGQKYIVQGSTSRVNGHEMVPVVLNDEFLLDLTDRVVYVINGMDGSLGKVLSKF